MKKTEPAPSRRDLLKVLGLGGVTATALPAQWSKPIVESVLLPAHAQTTHETTTPGCGPVSIPGRQLLCPSPGDTETATRYVFSLQDGCLVFESQTVDFDPDASPPDNELIIAEIRDEAFVRLILTFPGGGGVEATANCDFLALTSFPFTGTISAGGQDFQVSTQVSQFVSPVPGCSFTDLLFTPL